MPNINLWVDMGLPSGTLWAKCNIDVTQPDGFAASPYQYDCSFFSWGNIEGHAAGSGYNFSADVYAQTQGASLMGNIPVNSTYDVARHNLGVAWRMPTSDEFQELKNNCDSVWTQEDGVTGLRFTSRINGNSIFFPASGFCRDTNLNSRGGAGYYDSASFYSQTKSYILYISPEGVHPTYDYGTRFLGFPVRPVLDSTIFPYDYEVEYLEGSGTQYIDTGINAASDVTFELAFSITTQELQGPIMGGRNGRSNGELDIYRYKNLQYGGYIGWRYGNKDTNGYTQQTSDFFITNTDSPNVLVVNGVSLAGNEQTFTTQYSIYLFSMNNGGTNNGYANGLQIKSCKLYKSDTLVRDFIPVIKNSIGYVYDKVSGQLFGNAGTGDFIVGPVVKKVSKRVPAGYTEIEELNANGRQCYVSSLITAKLNVPVAFKTKIKWNSVPATGWRGMGCSHDPDWGIYNGNWSSKSGRTGSVQTGIWYDITTQTVTKTDSRNVGVSLVAFADNATDGTHNHCDCAIKDYYAIYENGVLVYCGIPCTNPQGTEGLWDSIGQQFWPLVVVS